MNNRSIVSSSLRHCLSPSTWRSISVDVGISQYQWDYSAPTSSVLLLWHVWLHSASSQKWPLRIPCQPDDAFHADWRLIGYESVCDCDCKYAVCQSVMQSDLAFWNGEIYCWHLLASCIVMVIRIFCMSYKSLIREMWFKNGTIIMARNCVNKTPREARGFIYIRFEVRMNGYWCCRPFSGWQYKPIKWIFEFLKWGFWYSYFDGVRL